jgi:protease IV
MNSVPAESRPWYIRVWRVIDVSRRVVLNAIFLLILAIILFSLLRGGGPKVSDKSALLLNLSGTIAEQQAGGVRERLQNEVQGRSVDQVRLRDVIAGLDAAAKDSKITSVVLLLDDLNSAGLPVLRDTAAALERFKASGKKVVAWGSGYDQRQYYLAAHADEVYMHPMGMVMIEGFGRYRNYYKDAFDKVGINPNVIRVGQYKNAGEPFFANAPSKATIESETYLFNALWATYTEAVEKARKLPAGSIAKNIEELPQQFAAVSGNGAKLALQQKLVDKLMTRDEFRALMIERGVQDKESKSFRQIALDTYLLTIKPRLFGDAVAVVVAEGEISDGSAPGGRIGGRSTAELIRKARDDDNVKALVLRVNSPGGSAYGSELIRREMELTQKAGKPVVVSMGNVAASGGYWVAMAADEVIADPATITGSIGVFAMLPTAEKVMEKISVSTGGVKTTWLSNAYDPRRPLDPRIAEMVQGAITNVYTEFTTKAAAARKTTPEKIDEVGQGRVWTGAQAKERGLIDRTGGFADAIKSAATKAKLSDDPRVMYVEREPSTFERLLEKLGGNAMASIAKHFDTQIALSPLGAAPIAATGAREDLQFLTEMMEKTRNGLPFVAVAHCFCDK